MVTVGLATITGNTGGEIRHPEIVSAQETPSTVGAVGAALVASVHPIMTAANWRWATGETLHFIGMALLFGVVLLVNLRMLGIAKNVSFAALHRLLPWGFLGLAINLITGMLFFIAVPSQYTQNFAFQLKILLVVLAGVNALYFTVFDEPWAVGPGDDAPLTAKVIAASTIGMWSGVMIFGRLLPYLGLAGG